MEYNQNDNYAFSENTSAQPNVNGQSGHEDKQKQKRKLPKLPGKVKFIAAVIAVSIFFGCLSGFLTVKLLSGTSMGSRLTGGNYSVETLNANNNDNAGVKASIQDTVVAIQSQMEQGIQRATSAGSGVIISKDGYIVTNNHVIADATEIKVTTRDNKEYAAKLVGTDAKTDLAVLKIDASNLTAIQFGSSSSLKVGQTAFAIGNPLGTYAGTVTKGIISSLDREITIDGTTMNLLQTDASINSGNSGGALVDADGNLIGIVVAKSSGISVEGLGFAIPVDDVKPVVEELMNNGYVKGRPTFNMTITEISSREDVMANNVSRSGLYVVSVNKNGAAAKAGVQAGDYIYKLNGTKITGLEDFNKIFDKLEPGDKAELTVMREGKQITVTVKLNEYQPNQ